MGLRFILGAKETDHRFLFEWVSHTATTKTHEFADEQDVIHRFRYLNNAPLNDANFETEINFLEYWEIQPSGKTKHFSWVTDIRISTENLMVLMRSGRARWKVENETFNTLKNQGYHFEHNFAYKDVGKGREQDAEALVTAINTCRRCLLDDVGFFD